MPTITDPRTRLLILADLVRDPSGLSPEQASELRALSAEELVRLTSMPEPRLMVTMDGAITMGIRRAVAVQERDDARRYCILHGAPFELLHDLFKLDAITVAAERKALGTPTFRRPPIPGGPRAPVKGKEGEAVRAAMEAWHWERTKGGKDSMTAADWVAMHKAFPIWPMATLWAVTRDARPAAPEKPKRKYTRRSAPLKLVASAA